MTTRPDDPVHPVAGGLTKREYFAAFFVEASQWHDSIRAAIRAVMEGDS